MADDAKLAKYLLENGSLRNKINKIVQDTVTKYLFKYNDAVTRNNMIKEIETQLWDLEDKLDISFDISLKQNNDNFTYDIHYLDKKISFTVQAG